MNYVIYPGGAGGSYISYKINEWSGLIDINHHRLQHRGLNEYRSHRNNVVFKFHPSVEKDSVYYSQNVLDSDTTFIIEVDDQQKVFVDLIRFFKWFFQKNYYGMAIDLIEKFMGNLLDLHKLKPPTIEYNNAIVGSLVEPDSILALYYLQENDTYNKSHFNGWIKQKIIERVSYIQIRKFPNYVTKYKGIVHQIDYHDLFVKCIDTGTLFDYFKEDNKEYHLENVKLIKKVEKEFDIDLREHYESWI